MILDSLARAFKTQNWFAVALEFFIVVTGVLLAFQVSTWSQEAGDRAYARDVLTRLHGELIAHGAVRARGANRRAEQLHHLQEARPIVMGKREAGALSSDQCIAIASSHYVVSGPDAFPSLDELMTSGAVESIRSDDLRKAAMELFSKRSTVRVFANQSVTRVLNLAIEYPDAVQQTLIPDPDDDDDGWDRSADCDLAAMRASTGFQAAFLANTDAYLGHVEFVYRFLDDAVDTLRKVLEAELNLAAGDAAGPAP